MAMRLSTSPRAYENEQADLARKASRQLPAITDRVARADVILGIRAGQVDHAPLDELLEYGHQVLELGLRAHSPFHIAEGLAARVVDLIRAGRITELPAAVRAQREYAERSGDCTARYIGAVINAMLALAHGEFDAAESYTAHAGELSKDWGDSLAQEGLMGQAAWLLYETGRVAELAEFLRGVPKKR